jgi:hypothetical protein
MLVKYSLFVNWLCRLVLAVLVVATVTGSASAQGTGRLQGVVFEDYNFDGVQSEDEPGIQSKFTIFGPVSPTVVTTNEFGVYSVEGLPAGTYKVLPPSIPGYSLLGGPNGYFNFIDIRNGQNTFVPFPYENFCYETLIREVKCLVTEAGVFQGYSVKFDFTNLSTFAVKKLVFTPPPGVTIQFPGAPPNVVPFTPAVATANSATRTVTITGVNPGFICIPGSLHDASGSKCCNMALCITVPKCECFQFFNQTFNVIDESTVQWCFSFQNLTNQPSKGIKFNLPAGVTMTPNPLNLTNGTSLLLPYQTTTACVTISGVALGAQFCFEVVLTQDSFDIEVCKKQIELFNQFPHDKAQANVSRPCQRTSKLVAQHKLNQIGIPTSDCRETLAQR